MLCSAIFLSVVAYARTSSFRSKLEAEFVGSPVGKMRRSVTDWDFNDRVIVGRDGPDVCLWSVTDGRLLKRHRRALLLNSTGNSGTGKLLNRKFSNVRNNLQDLYIWNDLSPSGRFVASSVYQRAADAPVSTSDAFCVVWDLRKNGQKICTLQQETLGAFSPDDKLFATFHQQRHGASPYDARLFNTATFLNTAHLRLPGVAPDSSTLDFSPSGESILFSSQGVQKHGSSLSYTLALYDAVSGKQNSLTESPFCPVFSRFIHGGSQVAWIGFWAGISLWDYDLHGPNVTTLKPKDSTLSQRYITLDGGQVLGVGHGKLQVWDLPTGKLNTRTFPSLYGPDQWTSLLVSPDDKSCAIYNVDRVKGKGTLFLYKTSDLTLLGRIALDASHVPIGFSTDGKQLLIAGPSFSWYDARKGQKVKSFKLEGWSFRKDMTWCKLISGSNL